VARHAPLGRRAVFGAALALLPLSDALAQVRGGVARTISLRRV